MTAREAIEVIKSECYVFNALNFDRTKIINTALDKAVLALQQSKRLGRWEPNKNDDICCSICGEMALSPSFWECDLAASKYCPNCGAKMSNAESDL